ncbi:hypothetical protein VZ52_20300 [Ralstonia mannitolilytica]|nr:hypothetical protein VZ52_20300 [Ralstonia mannitolilytica]
MHLYHRRLSVDRIEDRRHLVVLLTFFSTALSLTANVIVMAPMPRLSIAPCLSVTLPVSG